MNVNPECNYYDYYYMTVIPLPFCSAYQCIITELMTELITEASGPGQNPGCRCNASGSLQSPKLVPHSVTDLPEPQFLHL